VANLILGPALRYVDETDATVWVETDAPCVVEVLGHRAKTFTVCGHHFALVHVSGLEPGTTTEYGVALDGESRWPEPGSPFPPSVIRTPHDHREAKIVFGSCRVSVPHEPPYTLRKDEDDRGREVDALYALAVRMRDSAAPRSGPTCCSCSATRSTPTRSHRGRASSSAAARLEPAAGRAGSPDFEEYAHLYWESWGEPVMPLADVDARDRDDLRRPRPARRLEHLESWVAEMRELDWWDERLVGAFMSYWCYQHIGNLPPDELHQDEMWDLVCGCEDGEETCARSRCAPIARRGHAVELLPRLRRRAGDGHRLARRPGPQGRAPRHGRRRRVGMDVRAAGRRDRAPAHRHVAAAAARAGLHYFEAWNEAVCAGAWGSAAAWAGEKLRRGLDLEHWAAFGESFERLTTRIREVAAGEHGPAPASIIVLSGDVHHAYLAEVAFPREAGVQSAVYQATCSPVRNPLDDKEKRVVKFGGSRTAHAIGRLMARSAGVEDPDLRWRFVKRPWFDNQVATLELRDREALLRIERTVPEEWERPRLHGCLERRLT
jgi:hypothetical protein